MTDAASAYVGAAAMPAPIDAAAVPTLTGPSSVSQTIGAGAGAGAPVTGDDANLDALERWHWALLGLAGRLPDELVSEARAWLAAGLRLDVAQAIAFAVTAGQGGGGRDELRLVRDELLAAGGDDDLAAALGAHAGLLGPTGPDGAGQAEAVEEVGPDPMTPAAWQFHPVEPSDSGPGAAIPVDLTLSGHAEGFDPPDRALVAAVGAEPTAVGLWRSWRIPAGGAPWPPPKRVYVVTVSAAALISSPAHSAFSPASGPVAVAARLGETLAEAGEPDPQVEVCPAGVEPPSYQVNARICGALLWARDPGVEASVARVFDEVDPDSGPRFAADRPRLADPLACADLLARLNAGTPVLGTSARMTDILDPDRGEVVPMTFRTDGSWVWTDTCAYYLDQHGVLPDPELVEHLTARPAVGLADEVVLHRVLAQLLGLPTEEPVWVVPQMSSPPVPDSPGSTPTPGRTDGPIGPHLPDGAHVPDGAQTLDESHGPDGSHAAAGPRVPDTPPAAPEPLAARGQRPAENG
ncbi:conserved hypothetical protein [Frankia sp. AiPs1]|uniref:hypothetical protein n=1 Tax=Frankia sp. AiPa1 TaxID=573492 RepID=UPI00202B8EA1|nr:hypothetical protein [Frankia sp. AiPa1]MCL9762490.1 hypothetical protein [Frankia sp. AiPa1]